LICRTEAATMNEETPKPPIMQAALVRGMVPDEELPGLWRQSVAPYFDARPVADTASRLPEIHQYCLGSILLAESRFPAQTYQRDRRWMRRNDDSDHLLLQLFVEGENRAVNGAQDYVQRADNVYAVNLGYQAKSVSTDARVLTLALPRDLVRDELPHLNDTCGAVFAPGSAAARLFSDYLVSLRASLADATTDEAPALTRATLGLLDALTSGNDLASSGAQHAAFRTACRYIESHLADAALDAGKICKHLRCSRATLYRLFSAQGGVHEYIRRRRLVASFKAIGSPKYRHRRIFDIALDFGFTSPSHFSHLFRAHFGMTPREARDAGLEPSPRLAPPASAGSTGEQAVEQMWLWAKTLAARPR
jgi:AraC-like DNA-binding protein